MRDRFLEDWQHARGEFFELDIFLSMGNPARMEQDKACRKQKCKADRMRRHGGGTAILAVIRTAKNAV